MRRPGREQAHRSRVRPTGLGALATLALLAGCSTGAAPSSGAGGRLSPRLTVPAAERLLASVMRTNNRANAALDTRLLAGYETGSAFTIDAAAYKAARLAHVTSSLPFTVKPMETILGPAGASPERFLVVGQTALATKLPRSRQGPCPDADTLLLFTRSPDGRFRIELEPAASGGAFVHIPTGPAGVQIAVPAQVSSSASGLAGRVAGELVHYEASGQLGSFRRSYFTGSCWQVPDPRAAVTSAQAAGFDARELFAPIGGQAVYSLGGGRGLVIFTLSTTETIVAPQSSAIHWRHSSSAPWTALLPAGLYGTVTEKGQVEIAALVGPGTGFELVGAYSGTTAVTGTKAAPAPAGGPPTLVSFPALSG